MVAVPASFRCVTTQIIHKCKIKKFWRYQFCSSEANGPCGSEKRPVSFVEDDIKTKTTENRQGNLHTPVLVEDVLHYMEPRDDKVFIDMTFGAGGHTQEFLKKAPGIKIYALDRDPLAYNLATKLATSKEYRPNQIVPLLGRFSESMQLLQTEGIEPSTVDGVLFDVGASSMQFDQSIRGFSLSKDGPLDMRMDGDRDPSQPSAADIVNNMDESDLHRIIRKYGEEKLSKKIAHAIVECRYGFGKITKTQQLAEIVASVFINDYKKDQMMRHSHVATKTFQALRIFVNNELNEINNGLEIAYHYLRPGGVCVGISFHSLEDRIFKRHFRGIDIDAESNMSIADHFRQSSRGLSRDMVEKALKKKWLPVEKKVVRTSYRESLINPRSRSAKLRAAIKAEL